MSRAMVGVEAPVTARRKQVTRQGGVFAAVVTVFGTKEQVLHATLSKVGEDGAQLTMDRRVPPSSLVKIEYADSFLLGEIVYCQPQGPDWIAGIKVEHGLFRLSAFAAEIRENWG